jgi:putative addiction module component (TIGR02574 family)
MASQRELLAQVMALPTEERAEFAHKLLRTLDDEADASTGVQAAWTQELDRRLADAKDHPDKLLSFDEVKQRMAMRRAARRAVR